MTTPSITSSDQLTAIADQIKCWASELGFSDCRIVEPDLASHRAEYEDWLAQGYQGEMGYLANHMPLRFEPQLLHEGTQRLIVVSMPYLPENVETVKRLNTKDKAYIARYALGRDYHKVIRKRLTELGKRIEDVVGDHGYRAFVDSAPVLERHIAEQAGMGWVGKNTLLLTPKAGSWFLLGELFTNLPLPVDSPTTSRHCGSCQACLDKCPTNAFVKPWVLDARKCISYLTIEYQGSIPVALRKAIGNRIFGCDDCQLVCPWTKFAKFSQEADFQPRHDLDVADLVTLLNWDEETFLANTAGSPIRRTGYECWQRNVAVALGNAPTSSEVIAALTHTLENTPSELVKEHVLWALEQHRI